MEQAKLTKQELDIIRLKETPVPVNSQGDCERCHRRIPQGYVPYVLGWRGVRMGTGFGLAFPTRLLCRPCGRNHHPDVPERSKPTRIIRIHKRTGVPQEEKQELSKKEIAKELFRVMEYTTPMGSRQLCKLAGIEWSEKVVQVLRILYKAGKIRFEEGKWLRQVQ